MFRGIWAQAPSFRSDSGRKVGQRFESLATSLQKATPTEREAQLKDIEARNPGLANRLRRFLDQSESAQKETLDRLAKATPKDQETMAGWPQWDPTKGRDRIDPGQGKDSTDQRPDLSQQPSAVGLTGQARHSIIFEPEQVPVMGTTAPPPGKVVAYAGEDTTAGAVTAPVVVGATSWQGLPISAILGAYSGIIKDD